MQFDFSNFTAGMTCITVTTKMSWPHLIYVQAYIGLCPYIILFHIEVLLDGMNINISFSKLELYTKKHLKPKKDVW